MRSCGARETHQEALSNRRFRESHAREDDKEEAKPYNDDSCHLAHGPAGVLKSRITMRLSDAGLRQRQTKLIYPNHRSPPWLTEDATRDRSNRLLGDGRASSRTETQCIKRAMLVELTGLGRKLS